MCFQFNIQVKKSYLMYTNIVESIKCIEGTIGTYHYLSKVIQTQTAGTHAHEYSTMTLLRVQKRQSTSSLEIYMTTSPNQL